MPLVYYPDHFLPIDFERPAAGNCGCCGQPKPNYARNGLLANKLAGRDQCNGCFFSSFRDDGDLCPALLKIENRIGRSPLGKKDLFCSYFDDSPAKPRLCQKGCGVETGVGWLSHGACVFDIESESAEGQASR